MSTGVIIATILILSFLTSSVQAESPPPTTAVPSSFSQSANLPAHGNDKLRTDSDAAKIAIEVAMQRAEDAEKRYEQLTSKVKDFYEDALGKIMWAVIVVVGVLGLLGYYEFRDRRELNERSWRAVNRTEEAATRADKAATGLEQKAEKLRQEDVWILDLCSANMNIALGEFHSMSPNEKLGKLYYGRGADTLKKLAALDDIPPQVNIRALGSLATVYGCLGRFDDAIKATEEAITKDKSPGGFLHVRYYNIACFACKAGQLEKSFKYLDMAINADTTSRDERQNFIEVAKTDPDLKDLRESEEFKDRVTALLTQ